MSTKIFSTSIRRTSTTTLAFIKFAIFAVLISCSLSQFSFDDLEEMNPVDSGIVVFNGNADGGALNMIGFTIHNAVFTNTDYTTVAGRQSITSKSEKAYSGMRYWKCVIAIKSTFKYVCINTNGTT